MVVALVLLTFASQIGEYYAGAFPYSFDFLYWEEVWQPATFSVGMVLVGPWSLKVGFNFVDGFRDPAKHLGCIKPGKWWHKLPTSNLPYFWTYTIRIWKFTWDCMQTKCRTLVCKLCHDLHVVQTTWAKWRIISPGIGAKIKNRDFLRPMEVVGDRRDLTRFGPETLFGDYVGYFLQEKKVF